MRTCLPPLYIHHFRAPSPKARLENCTAERSPAHVTHLLLAMCSTSFPSTAPAKRVLQKKPDCFATLGKTNDSDLSRSYSKRRFSGFSHCSHSRRLLSSRKANLEISTLAARSHLPCPQIECNSLSPCAIHRNERTPLDNCSLFLRGVAHALLATPNARTGRRRLQLDDKKLLQGLCGHPTRSRTMSAARNPCRDFSVNGLCGESATTSIPGGQRTHTSVSSDRLPATKALKGRPSGCDCEFLGFRRAFSAEDGLRDHDSLRERPKVFLPMERVSGFPSSDAVAAIRYGP